MRKMLDSYVHGYDSRANQRLRDQAGALSEILHHDTRFEAGASVLEIGCGVGGQTVILAPKSPAAHFTCVDINPASIEQARANASAAKLKNVEFGTGDISALPFADARFDHVFICFVLEHLADPVAALREARRVLKPGGVITVIEGDHGSVYFHPVNAAAHEAIGAQVTLQQRGGGDAMVGRRLFPLLSAAGFKNPQVSPRMVYVDDSRPALVESFTKKTFTDMVAGVREEAVKAGVISAARFDEGIEGLRCAAAPGGVFCYTFFKARAVVSA